MADSLLLVDKAVEGYAVVTLNRPKALNALSNALRSEFCAAFKALEEDAGTRVVILTGAGRAFCAGLDLKEWQGEAGDVAAGAFDSDPVRAMTAFSGPVIAAINGLTITGGLEITVACDIVIASSEAKFADTHVHAGLLPGWGLSARLCRAIGVQRAKEISLTGNFISAQQALDWGLVNRVVPPEQLLPQAIQLACDMLAGVPQTLVAYKKLINDGFALGFDEALAAERALAMSTNASLSPDDIGRRLAELKHRARTRGG